jgi:WD40 repeat protein
MALSPDNKKVILGSFDNEIYEVDLADGKINTYKGHKEGIDSLSFSPDGSKIVSGSRDKTIKEWDVKTGEDIATYEGHSDRINAVMYAGGKIIYTVNNMLLKREYHERA